MNHACIKGMWGLLVTGGPSRSHYEHSWAPANYAGRDNPTALINEARSRRPPPAPKQVWGPVPGACSSEVKGGLSIESGGKSVWPNNPDARTSAERFVEKLKSLPCARGALRLGRTSIYREFLGS